MLATILTRELTRSLTRGLNVGIGQVTEPVVITISGDAYGGGSLIIEGGMSPYEYVINGISSGIFTPDNIPFSLVEGDELSVMDSSGVTSNSLTAKDPLFDIPSLLDLRTHRGNKQLFGIAPDGEPNPIWTGVIGEAIQPNETSQPTTRLAGDGTPYLDFVAANSQWLSIGNFSGSVTYTVLIRSKTPTWNSYFGLIETSDIDQRWGYNEASFTYINLITFCRQDAVEVSSPYNLTNIDSYTVITVTTLPSGITNKGLAQILEAQFGDIEYIASFIYNGIPSIENIERVEKYYLALKPL